MRWLVKDAQPNDSLFFHYSGHGGQTKDLDGDEADGYDEGKIFLVQLLQLLTLFSSYLPCRFRSEWTHC